MECLAGVWPTWSLQRAVLVAAELEAFWPGASTPKVAMVVLNDVLSLVSWSARDFDVYTCHPASDIGRGLEATGREAEGAMRMQLPDTNRPPASLLTSLSSLHLLLHSLSLAPCRHTFGRTCNIVED